MDERPGERAINGSIDTALLGRARVVAGCGENDIVVDRRDQQIVDIRHAERARHVERSWRRLRPLGVKPRLAAIVGSPNPGVATDVRARAVGRERNRQAFAADRLIRRTEHQ